jgi:Protein of unknown function (DUF3800)
VPPALFSFHNLRSNRSKLRFTLAIMRDESHSARLNELGKTLFDQSCRATERQRSYFPRSHCAYIDDSGSHKEGPAFVMGGLVAGWSEWARFSEEWREVLEEKPRLAYFKLKEALRLEEQFGRLSPKQRDDRCDRLFSILKRTAVFAVTVSVAWDSLKIPLQLFPKIPLTPYQLLVIGLMGRVTSELTRMKLSPRIMFVFDDHNEGSRLERALDDLLPYIPEAQQKPVMGISHMDDREILPLQAADAVAWIARRLASEADDHRPDMSKWKPTQPYLQQLRGIPFLSSHYNDERLRNLYEMFFAVMKEKADRGITGNDPAFAASVASSKRHTAGAK